MRLPACAMSCRGVDAVKHAESHRCPLFSVGVALVVSFSRCSQYLPLQALLHLSPRFKRRLSPHASPCLLQTTTKLLRVGVCTTLFMFKALCFPLAFCATSIVALPEVCRLQRPSPR